MDEDFIRFSDDIVSGDAVQRTSCEKCRYDHTPLHYYCSMWETLNTFFRRPLRVCWCSYLPDTPVKINGKIIILQHPDEEKRNLKTGPMLFHGMTSGQCLIFYGKKFPSAKHQGLKEMLEEPHTYVLYPGPQSKCITDISHTHPQGESYNLVLIDGTWQQAKSMYFHSPFLHSLPQVQSVVYLLTVEMSC